MNRNKLFLELTKPRPRSSSKTKAVKAQALVIKRKIKRNKLRRQRLEEKRFPPSVSLKWLVAVAKRAGYKDLSKILVTMSQEYNSHAASWGPHQIRLEEKY